MGKALTKETGILLQFLRLVQSGSSTNRYYEAMNHALHNLKDEYTMLHYPLYASQEEDFLTAQKNLTCRCLAHVEPLEGKTVLEVGCGNGVQAKFIAESYTPKFITGIDLSRANIRIANREKRRRGTDKAFFLVDDAQKMKKIDDHYFDIVINIESAFHYPDKQSFLNEVKRVLAPGGRFVIADILTESKKLNAKKGTWKRNMVLHHWSLEDYLEGFRNAGLEVKAVENITEGVIMGFLNYKSYIKQMKKKGLLQFSLLKLFYRVNVALNTYYLRNGKQYYIFSGEVLPV